MSIVKRSLAATAMLLLAVSAGAHDYTHGDLTLYHPWTRATAPGAPVGGGFVIVRNDGDKADALLGGEADFATRVEIHQSVTDDGLMKMRKLESGLEIPAGETVTLQPGGYHIMIVGLSQRLVEGEQVPVTLNFREAGPVTVEFKVQAPGESSMDHDD